MNPKKEQRSADDIITTLGAETFFNGTLRFTESLKILGRCEGRIESDGFLIIEKGAEVIADIKVGSIVVGGTIKGNVEATEQTDMLASGKVYGNIRTGQLRMADGVVFEGKIEMLKNADALDVFSATPSQLKQSLEII